jgi:trimethylamine---corrinoid protein Co-methyltransferase
MRTWEILDGEEIAAIDRASREVLAEVGVRIGTGGLLDEWEGRGLSIERARGVVRIEPRAVEDALARVPRRVEVFRRDGAGSIRIGGGERPRFAAGFNATFDAVFDAGQAGTPGASGTAGGTRRRPGIRDVAECALLSHHLGNIDVVGPLFIPHDVPSASSLLHALHAVLDNTTKPVLFAPENDAEAEGALAILAEAGGEGAAAGRPIGICQFSPSSPLFWNEGTLRGFLRVARAGFPCTILPGPLAGATSPYTLAANLVQKNAEMLCGLVIAQLANPGTPLLTYNGGGQLEMSAQCAVFGTPEISLILMAGSQLARHYGIPSHACIPCSDSHVPDQQLGMENGVLFMSGLASGTDLMVNAGMFASGETASREQLVIDNEMIGTVRRIAAGMAVDPAHLCADSFRRVGPGGSYLDDPSTLENLRSGEWSTSPLWERRRFERWQERGSPSILSKARAAVEELRGREAPRLPAGTTDRIRQIIRGYEAW